MPYCTCGSHVTEQFKRVFSPGSKVNGCPDCQSYRKLSDEDIDPAYKDGVDWGRVK